VVAAIPIGSVGPVQLQNISYAFVQCGGSGAPLFMHSQWSRSPCILTEGMRHTTGSSREKAHEERLCNLQASL
jgi:hypothetical protein